MVHMATTEFYADVTERLGSCDVILYEGVKSSRTKILSSSYRLFAGNKRINLVPQHSMNLDHLQDKLVHADIGTREFEARWQKINLWKRLSLYILSPLVGLYLRFFGSRRMIAQGLNFNFQPSRQEILESSDDQMVSDVLLDWRDAHLISQIDQQITAHEGVDIAIGVLFGARHMRAVIEHLRSTYRYAVSNSEWMIVFPINEKPLFQSLAGDAKSETTNFGGADAPNTWGGDTDGGGGVGD